MLKDNNQPYADIIFNEGNCIVQYIDDYNRIYMTYTFVGDVKSGYLFLNELQYFIYPKDLQEFAMRRANIEYNQYNFTIDGKLTVTKEIRENNRTIYKTADEAAHPIYVSKNWEPYPNLGEYESIVKMKRWEDGDFLKNPPSADFMKMITPN